MLDSTTAFDRLRSSGLRLTPQRRFVIEALVGDTTHPTAEDVARRLEARAPGMSLSTVYKVLHELTALGLIRELEVPGAMRFDPNVDDHMHVVCESCGTVRDVTLPSAVALAIAEAVSGATGSLARVDVVVTGTGCGSCA